MRRSIGNAFPRVGAILHLGAGLPPPIQDYLSTGCEQIVLIDPDPDVVRAMARIGSGQGRVTAVRATPAREEGDVALHRCRLAEWGFLALSESGVEGELPPRAGGSLQARALSIAEILEQAYLPPDGNHWLVVDMPSGRAEMLQRLMRHGALDLFSCLSLVKGRWTGALRDEGEALRTVEDAGFHLLRDDGHASASFHHARRGQLWKAHQDLRAELRGVRTEVDRLAAEREALVSAGEEAAAGNSEAMDRLRKRMEKMASEVSVLRDRNRGLEGENERHRAREAQLSSELARAEDQMALLKELFGGAQGAPP